VLKKLEANDIVKVLKINDEIPCSRDQWVQFLMSLIKNERIMMLGDMDEEVLSYAVIVDNRIPPISNNASVLHFWAKNYKRAKYLFNFCTEELKKRDIQKAVMEVSLNHTKEYIESFGGKIKSYICEWGVE